MTSWEIRNGEEKVFVSTREYGTKSLLGRAVNMWTQERDVSDWDDREKMAAICFYFSDLSEKEIKSIFGVTGEGQYPGDPPWELTSLDESTLYIEKD